MKTLIFGCTHVTPESEVKHLHCLGDLISKYRPDNIVCLGDFTDFASLMYKKDARGEYTTEEELQATKDALSILEMRPKEYNRYRREIHKTLYRPRKILCKGNHDDRLKDARFDDIFEGAGWEVVPYREPVTIDGVHFCHIFERGITGAACTTAEEILANTHCKTFSGHGHRFDYSGDTTLEGEKIFAVRIPCFRTDTPSWAGQGSLKWDRGVVLLNNDVFTYVPMETL